MIGAHPAGPEISASATRTLRVEHIMGTAIAIDVREPAIDAAAIDAAFALLRDVDARFSSYRADSEISRIARGELDEADASRDVRWVLGLCDDLARTSGGFFDARGHRPDGALDPSGLVKGWALEEASVVLEDAGARNFSVNGGGDIVVRGEPAPGSPWRVGVRHPRRSDRVAGVLAVRDLAVATSGTYERGDHVFDPHTRLPATSLLSVTVVGPSLTYADAYATAALAMGIPGMGWLAQHDGYGAYAITAEERVVWTPSIDDLLVDPE